MLKGKNLVPKRLDAMDRRRELVKAFAFELRCGDVARPGLQRQPHRRVGSLSLRPTMIEGRALRKPEASCVWPRPLDRAATVESVFSSSLPCPGSGFGFPPRLRRF